MITWGISANSHDAALAVFLDEKLVFASHSERFSGIKNDKHLCQEIVDYAKNNFGGLPNRVVWYENPYFKTARQLKAGQGWKWQDNNIKKYLAKYGIDCPISYVDHHKSHAAAGYYTSPFEDAAVVVIDAIGEFTTYSIWRGCKDKLKRVFSLEYPHSLGLFYSAMTQRCYLKPNEDEYILMGMAAYGDADKYLKSMLHDFISVEVDPDFKHPFTLKQNLHRGCQTWRPELNVKDTFDIAASTQLIYELALDNCLNQAKQYVGSDNLVLMGGCALNSSANRIIGKYFKNIWIHPDPTDAGSAIGAVLAKHPNWAEYTDWNNPYLGYNIDSTSSDQDIVDHLEQVGICGLARHRAEFGPRALGNRSLLADPRHAHIKDQVNEIKQRQLFRPFAPAILEELVSDYFRMPYGWDTSRYMQSVAICRNPELFPAIVHRDGTSRVQTVPNDGSPFRKLLELWYARTGCPMLLNTSLNIRGKPMVNTRADAEEFERQYSVRVFT